MKKNVKFGIRECPWHKTRFNACPSGCGYASHYADLVNKAIMRRKRKKEAKRRKSAAVLKRWMTRLDMVERRIKNCRCGATLRIYERRCPACEAIKKSPKKPGNCLLCQKPLSHSWAKYCSNNCRSAYVYRQKRNTIHRPCSVCGAQLPVKQKKFCSTACHKIGKPQKSHPHHTHCSVCQRPTGHRSKFCSKTCKGRQKKLNRRLRGIPNKKKKSRRKAFPPAICVCGKAFTPKTSANRYCTAKCADAAYHKKRDGTTRARIRRRLSGRMRELLRMQGLTKRNSILAYIGCSHEELLDHLKSKFSKGMTMQNYGLKGWHMDHIIPCERFDLTREDHCMVCFNWRNIRPLWGTENIARQHRLSLDEALQIDPELVEMAREIGVNLWQ